MKQATAIKCLSAIAHDGRLGLMRRLIQTGPTGISSGKLAEAENINASTASAQLLVLFNSGLVTTERNGKQIVYRAEFTQFQNLLSFLMEDCCKGISND